MYQYYRNILFLLISVLLIHLMPTQAQSGEFSRLYNLVSISGPGETTQTGAWEFTFDVGFNKNVIQKNLKTNATLWFEKVGQWREHSEELNGKTYPLQVCRFKHQGEYVDIAFHEDLVTLLFVNSNREPEFYFWMEAVGDQLAFNEDYKDFTKYYFDVKSTGLTTDVKVKEGDWIKINASGRIKVGQFAGNSGPEGINGFALYNRDSDFLHGALLVKIGSSFNWMGTNREFLFKAERSGVLKFMVNDIEPGNNSGVYSVEVTHFVY